jgi:lipopolysaccharide transport system permease protein/teichoic acid transport system permease protein
MNSFKGFISFIIDILKLRHMIFAMAKNDFKVRYLGSYLGIVWAFIQPITTICVMWFVFEIGFRTSAVQNVPFILWLSTGMIPWFFLNEAIVSGTNSIIDQAFLVKKVVFRVSILPVIKICASLFIHAIFGLFLVAMYLLYGYCPTLHYIQIFYYLLGMCMLILGISWITSALTVFVRDVGQIVGVILQLVFWATPIFWSLNTVPSIWHKFFYLNPAYFIVEGYRNTFIYGKWFWEQDIMAIMYFWGVTVILFVVGALVFKRLRPHFADVL